MRMGIHLESQDKIGIAMTLTLYQYNGCHSNHGVVIAPVVVAKVAVVATLAAGGVLAVQAHPATALVPGAIRTIQNVSAYVGSGLNSHEVISEAESALKGPLVLSGNDSHIAISHLATSSAGSSPSHLRGKLVMK